ncbi:hypothetical protein [Polyangium jinanense]|uniref:Uncharacterized protein n=1 Tax=Polyangium jinanense TaxID=2829994 RepID=A0A9X3X0I3_9BACT|nr:hypothetical protein [Polyangium jinanense]MDC3954192.1 hypothetical protein [Polyangium jinanense]MDC3981852.1 hypothetical protein [Polyangium jinanense]
MLGLRESWLRAWGMSAALLAFMVVSPGEARAGDTPRCSTWRAAGKGYEKLELRTCARPEGDESEGESEGDDEDAASTVEIKSGYEDALKVRIELVTKGGTVEQLDVKLKNGENAAGSCKACRGHDDVKSFRVTTQDGAGEGKDPTPEPLQKVAGTNHMEVLARDLRLTDTNAKRLERIAARYHKATKKRLVVTGGTRTPQRQAQLMYDKLKRGDDVVALYENKAAATEVQRAYREAASRGEKRKGTIRAMREVIEAQIGRGTYVSKHLKSGAVDVRSWNMDGALEKALREAVKQEPGVTLMDERDGPEPHFHLNLL